MKLSVFLLLLLVCVSAELNNPKALEPCDENNCRLPECRCASFDIPGGLSRTETPQFLMIAIEGAVVSSTISIYREAFYNRTNPDGCSSSVSVTAGTPFTSFSLVKELYSRGMEIALPPMPIEHDDSVEAFTEEYVTQRKHFNTLAQIPENDIKGVSHRFTYTSPVMNNLYSMMVRNGFQYEFSSGVIACVKEATWPFTLEYDSFPTMTNDCWNWPFNVSFPGVWMIQPRTWRYKKTCLLLNDCDAPEDAIGVTQFLIREFLHLSDLNRVPITLRVHNSWFNNNGRLSGFITFLDYLKELPDVFVVSPSKVIEWIQRPKTITEIMNNPSC